MSQLCVLKRMAIRSRSYKNYKRYSVFFPDAAIALGFISKKRYECKICLKSIALKKNFRSHIYSCHSDLQKQDVRPGSCVFCGVEIHDPIKSKHHYNNMECMAILHCTECSRKFTSHGSFVQHIYQVHVPEVSANNNDSLVQQNPKAAHEKNELEEKPCGELRKIPEKSESKKPHACGVCGQSYNNKNNVLRHMESKHPDQLPATYKCPKCEVGYPRLSMLRNHTIKEHQCKLEKLRQENIVCQICFANFDSRDKWLHHKTGSNKNFNCCKCNYQNPDLSDFLKHSKEHTNVASKASLKMNIKSKPCSQMSSNDPKEDDSQKHLHIENDGDDEREKEDSSIAKEPPRKKAKYDAEYKECMECHSIFATNLGLANHMRIHNTQPQPKALPTSSTPQISFKLPLDVDLYLEHMPKDETELDEKSYSCYFCAKWFCSHYTLRQHILHMHQIDNNIAFKCSLCSTMSTSMLLTKRHIEQTHGPSLFNPSDVVVYEYKCHFCTTAFENKEVYKLHMKVKHPEKKLNPVPAPVTVQDKSTFWFQCRYCCSNFDTNKKLAIHVNAHYEYDSKDYSCKDCGNVYSGRKSLWVHRYKKHPMVSRPTPCSLCEKVFFNSNMYELHMQLVHQQKDENSNLGENTALKEPPNQFAEKIQFSVDEIKTEPGTEEITCTLCNEKFRDADLYSKHVEKHDFYTNNPLAAMLDASPSRNKRAVASSDHNGDYTCDICPKTFLNNLSLKMHRHWHFRMDSKKGCTGPQKKNKARSSYRCCYCNSTFVNSSNLKRHIMELHKNEASTSAEPVVTEKYLSCSTCNIVLPTRTAWINHSIEHVRQDSKASSSGWACVICGRLVSRKHRLIQHMNSHLRKNQLYESSSPGLGHSPTSAFDDSSNDHQVSDNIDEEKMRDAIIVNPAKSNYNDGSESEDCDRTSSGLDFNDDTSSDDDKEQVASSESHSCDLCHITFYTYRDLQLHVATHFLNGPGSVTLTEDHESAN